MKVELACSLTERLRGLLCRKEYPDILLLVPCNDVHTFGMRQSIDVAFASSRGLILESHRNVGANRRLRCKAASITLERIASRARWFEQGDRLELKGAAMEALEREREAT